MALKVNKSLPCKKKLLQNTLKMKNGCKPGDTKDDNSRIL